MAKGNAVRVFVGTRKGGYIAESDRRRAKWTVRGPFWPGRDVFHLAADPREDGAVYAAVNSGFWGPMLLRSTDWGRKWKEIAPPMMTVSSKRPKPSPDGTSAPSPIVNLWHIEPGPANEPKSLYLGVDPASLYRSDDRGNSWEGVAGLNEHETRPKWNPGAGGLCLHTILIDPSRPSRRYVGISAAGTFKSDDGGEHWRPVNKGVKVSFLPDPNPPFGQCVHKVALDPLRPETAYRQDHDGIYVSHDAMESWQRIGRPLPTDFGFAVTTAAALPGTAFFAPLQGTSRTATGGQLQVYRWTEKDRKWTPTVKGRPWPGELGTHREALAADALDPAGVYLGTTTGDLLFTNNAARTWGQVPYHFPAIHSVSVASPAG
ncbi:MAG TPA: exo-alpha-sialidase [Thermoplasmata archaeon]